MAEDVDVVEEDILSPEKKRSGGPLAYSSSLDDALVPEPLLMLSSSDLSDLDFLRPILGKRFIFVIWVGGFNIY